MKKEVIVAILIGLVLGLIITYGYYRAQTAGNADQNPDLSATPEPSPNVDQAGNLVLHSPQDEVLTDNQELQVAGTTDPGAFVVVFINEAEHVTTADESGNFSVSGKLSENANVIAVYSIDEDGKTSTIERTVVYSTTSLLEPDLTATPAAKVDTKASPSPSANPKASASPKASPSPKTTAKPTTTSKPAPSSSP